MRLSGARQDRLVGVSLQSRPRLTGREAAEVFAEPGSALDALTAEFQLIWDHHRSDDFSERVTGTLELASGAYVQWIGYGHVVVVEVSSNAYLRQAVRLDHDEEQRLVRCGFHAPGGDDPNFWLEVEQRSGLATAAFAVVAAFTTVFGIYAG